MCVWGEGTKLKLRGLEWRGRLSPKGPGAHGFLWSLVGLAGSWECEEGGSSPHHGLAWPRADMVVVDLGVNSAPPSVAHKLRQGNAPSLSFLLRKKVRVVLFTPKGTLSPLPVTPKFS